MIDGLTMKINSYLRKLEMSPETGFLAEFNNDGELIVKGCCDISVYTCERVLLICKTRTLNIKGNSLFISVFGSDSTVITGKILSVDFI